MDLPLLHTAMELSAAACLFFISWLNITYKASGRYSIIMAIGTALAGAADLVHAFTVHVAPSFMMFWEPWSWSVTRFILLMTFMFVCLCNDVFNCKTKFISILLSIPLVSSILVAVLYGLDLINLSWVYNSFDLFGLIAVNRPLDFLLLIGWTSMAILLRSKAQVIFPPNVYWLFMLQGVALHAVVAFGSAVSTDMAFWIAHGLKISEYYTFILVYLLYKNELDNMTPIHKYHHQLSKHDRADRWHQWKT